MGGRAARQHADTTKKAEILQRRDKVIAGIAAGTTYETMALQLGVSKATIAADMKALAATWKEKHAEQVNAYILISMARLEKMLSVVWPDALGGTPEKPVERSDRNTAQERVLAVIDREIKLLGLERQPGESEDHPMYVTRIEVLIPAEAAESEDDSD